MVLADYGPAFREIGHQVGVKRAEPGEVEHQLRQLDGLEWLPVNANGKLDRAALLWCEQLGLDTISVESSFFQLGGNSLTVTRLLNRIRTQFGRRIDLLKFFSTPTVRGMAALLPDEAKSSP